MGINTPSDATLAAGAGRAWAHSLMSIWAGGCRVSGYGTKGAYCLRGGGEHRPLQPDSCGLLTWDVGRREWKFTNRATTLPRYNGYGGPAPTPDGSAPTDVNWGTYVEDGLPNSTHTYNSVQELPPGWHPSFPNGGCANVAHTLGTYAFGFNSAATGVYDITQATGGFTRLTGKTGNQATSYYDYYDGTGVPANRAIGNDACGSGVDYRRKGWWSRTRQTNDGNGFVSFTNAITGVITNYAPSPPRLNEGYAQFHVFTDEGGNGELDLLVLLGGPASGPAGSEQDRVYVSKMPGVPGAGFVAVNLVHKHGIPDNLRPLIGYLGFRWCSHPNIQAFLAVDASLTTRPGSGNENKLRILRIKPPPPGQRFTAQWLYTSEIVIAEDGTIIRNIPGQTNTNDSSFAGNGTYGRGDYSPEDHTFYFPLSSDRKMVGLRTADMS
jgi:hypothetical protein